jgi:uncharacterized protein YbcC (UPF0753/DUF2309 family)
MGTEGARLETIHQLVAKAGELLPPQGPITNFLFLNTLQALEDLPFDEGLEKGARLFGCQTYLSEQAYRDKMATGRIRVEELDAVMQEDLQGLADAPVTDLCTRAELRCAMLRHRLLDGPPQELRWFVAETDALSKMLADVTPEARVRFIADTKRWVMRDLRTIAESVSDLSPHVQDVHHVPAIADLLQNFGEATIERWTDQTWESFALQSLWRICRSGVQGLKTAPPPATMHLRHRDVLLEATGEDSDQLVTELLVTFCASYTDQGFGHWALPHRDLGFFKSFMDLYGHGGGPPLSWLAPLSKELARIRELGLTPLESIAESLELLGVPEEEWDDYITASIIALRGWASLIWHMEIRSDRMPLPAPPGTLDEFLAVRLILDRLATAYVATYLPEPVSLADLRTAVQAQPREKDPAIAEERRAFLIYQLAQVMGWTPAQLYRLPKSAWGTLVAEVEAFTCVERRRLFHAAFERRYRVQALDAISVHTDRKAQRIVAPRFQATFCIDAREESFRRHLHELAPDVETFGLAGFYGVAMYYKGVADAHFAAQCPIVVRPQHWVVEDVVYSLEETHRRRARTRKAIGTATHQVHARSRSFFGGALLTGGLGVLASVPLVARVLFPRLTAQIRRTAGSFVEPPPVTRLRLERTAPTPSMEEDGIGYSVEEMANIGERMLRDIGLTHNFARLVIFFGHGSFCLNNPHMSAYNCGACTGSVGGPNGRALAAMLNEPRVREIIAKRGFEIPKETIFVGGLHNTSAETLTFYDLDLLPKSHLKDFQEARDVLEKACERNAHERCRRFDSAPLDISLAGAHRHVENRSEDLAQTRPEFGNASNAMCFVGRGERVRGLYMDRRAFQQTYDPTSDDAEATILGRILSAVIPVCEGINMQYFFSYVDSPGWGSGTKLPHNVTSLMGVMDGAASDLRGGLPWQSVEIHEPVRCLFILETRPELIEKIMNRIPIVGKILRNGWAQLALLDPDSNKIKVYRHGAYHDYEPETTELPRVASSIDWYRGWRDNLGFAQIVEKPVSRTDSERKN